MISQGDGFADDPPEESPGDLSDRPTNRAEDPHEPSKETGLPVVLKPSGPDLATLHEADREAEEGFYEGQYARLAVVLAWVVFLKGNREERRKFFQDSYWKQHRGWKPREGQDGPDQVLEFAIRRVFGGHTRQRIQRASMLLQSARTLMSEGVRPEDVVAELQRRGGGLKATARRRSSSAEARCLDAIAVGPVEPQADGGLATSPSPPTDGLKADAADAQTVDEPLSILEADYQVIGGEPPPIRAVRRTITVVCPAGAPTERLPDPIYLIRDSADGEYVLSIHSEEPVEIRLPADSATS